MWKRQVSRALNLSAQSGGSTATQGRGSQHSGSSLSTPLGPQGDQPCQGLCVCSQECSKRGHLSRKEWPYFSISRITAV